MGQELVTTDNLITRGFGLLPFLRTVLSEEALQEVLQECIDQAKATLEGDLEAYWEQKVIRQTPPAAGDEYDVTETPLDYYAGQITAPTGFPRWTLNKRPVVSVQLVRFAFSDKHRVMDVPEDWWKINHKLGVFEMVPMGTAAMIASTGTSWFIPVLGGRLQWATVPQFLHIDYTAGYYDPAADTLPADAASVRKGIVDAAYLDLLQRAQGIVPTGGSSGGSSQTFASMETRLKEANERVQGFRKWWARNYRPVKMIML